MSLNPVTSADGVSRRVGCYQTILAAYTKQWSEVLPVMDYEFSMWKVKG